MDGGVLRGVMLKAGACDLGLSQDDWAKGRDRKKGEGMRIWCQTAQDIDALAAPRRLPPHDLSRALGVGGREGRPVCGQPLEASPQGGTMKSPSPAASIRYSG